MKASVISILFFIAGVVCAHNDIIPELLLDSRFALYTLYVQMFLVGMCIGCELDKTVGFIKKLHVRIFLVPLVCIVGTYLGMIVLSIFMNDISLKDLMAVGSGFGYYSLSSIYITELRGELLGVIALLTNIVREIAGLLFTPLFAKFGKLAPISAAGATAMDTCLPIITTSVGKNYAIISVFSGTVITILVPFLVTFILS